MRESKFKDQSTPLLCFAFDTLYEYARTSDKLRPAIWDCLNKQIGEYQIREHILAALKRSQTEKRNRTIDDNPPGIRKIIEGVEKQLGIEDEGDCILPQQCYSEGVWIQIYGALFHATGNNHKLTRILMDARPDFPQPWMACPIPFKSNKSYNPVWMLDSAGSIFDTLKEHAIRSGRDSVTLDELEFLKEGYDGDYIVTISWAGATVKQIVQGFEKRIRAEAKYHPERKQRGRAGQRPVAPLAWLAAYRLQKAGITFDDAQIRLEEEDNKSGLLPKYSEKSGWSDAIKKAKQRLGMLESGRW